jgi:hypothetical protein
LYEKSLIAKASSIKLIQKNFVIPAQAGIQSIKNPLRSKAKYKGMLDKPAGFPPARE